MHVLLFDDWAMANNDDPEEQRRAYYVWMTRARQTLGLKDLFLDYAGQLADANPVHKHLKKLQTGDALSLRAAGAKIELVNQFGDPVSMLPKQAEERWRPLLGQVESLRGLALIERRSEDDREENFRNLLKAQRWEVPVVEVVCRQT